MTYDPFKLESGLLGNADVTVMDAEFLNDPAYNNGQTLQLALTLLIDGDDGGEKVENLSCGDGWETNDGGKTAVREDGKEKNFNGNSKVGRFFAGLVKTMAEDSATDKAIRARVGEYPLGPRDAGFWKGLQLHVDREEVDYGGEIGKRDVLVIDGFNGIQGGGESKAKAATGGKAAGAAKKAAGATKKAAAKAEDKAEGGLTDAIKAQLDKIADESADHDSFMERAFAEVPEASSDAAVKAAVSDDGEGSLWHEAVLRYEAAAGGEG